MSFGHGRTPDDDQLPFILITPDDDQGGGEWNIAITIACRLAVYVAIMAVMLFIVALIFKIMKSLGDDDNSSGTGGTPVATETNRLLPKEEVPFSYGAFEADVETGKASSNTSEDLYDGKICVICYDHQRNCFFVPCGHCATCYICALRITEMEGKTCPVCRRFIHKVRKLLVS